MSDTIHVIRHLSDYLDRALTAQERHAVEKHLEHCKECSAHYKELQHLRQRLKAVPELTPPESFYQGVLEQIERDKKPFLIWDWPVATKALATFGVLMIVVMVAREARRSEPELFAPVSPEAAPAAPISVSQPVAAPQPVSIAGLAEAPPEALKKSIEIKNGKSMVSMNGPIALQSKALRKAMVASNVASDDKEREENKDMDQLASTARTRESANKTLDLSGAAGASVPAAPMNMVVDKVALQARDINGSATQVSFAEAQQQLPTRAISPGSPNTEWKGDSSAITRFRTVVITNDADWKALWAERQQNEVSPSPAPAVDFSRFTVVGIFEGSKPSSGYAVTITTIESGSETITVNYREQTPAPGAITAAVMTQPYDIRLIPKTSLPITFIKQP